MSTAQQEFPVVANANANQTTEALARTETSLAPASTPTPMEVIERAIERGVSPEVLDKLLNVQIRWEQNEARKAFVAAMAEFKKHPPAIIKNAKAKITSDKGGGYTYAYATLDKVCDAAIEGLAKVGISHRWQTEQSDNGVISVTCILTHEKGHSESTVLRAAPDQSGGKNAIQAIGSTVHYLERYTLFAATGLAAAGTDDDGQAAGQQVLSDLNEKLEFLANCTTVEELDKLHKQYFNEAKKVKDTNAMNALYAAKNKRREELK